MSYFSSGFQACLKVDHGSTDPSDIEMCRRWRNLMKGIFEGAIIGRYFPGIPQPDFPGPIVDPGRLADPSPQPSISFREDFRDFLLGELFLDAIQRAPSPALPLFNHIRESGIYTEVVKNLIQKFDGITVDLKKELTLLEKRTKAASAKE